MFLDEVARMFLEKLRSRQLDRQIADGYFGKLSVRFVRRMMPLEIREIAVVPVTISRNAMLESAAGRAVLAQVPFARCKRCDNPGLALAPGKRETADRVARCCECTH